MPRTVSSHKTEPTPDDVFRERCEARAILVTHGLMDLQEAVDGLQEAAEAYGLVDLMGVDYVQNVMAEAFS